MDSYYKYKFITVDDEPHALKGVNQLLLNDPEIEIVTSCENGTDAIEKINQLGPDIVLMDVMIPHINGVEVFKHLNPGVNPMIIFITASDQYALKAFETDAIAYLLKPFNEESFYKKIEKAKKLCLQEKHQNTLENLAPVFNTLHRSNSYPDRIIIKVKGEIIFLRTGSIHWIDADDYQVNIKTTEKIYSIRETVNNFESKLDPERFIRIHRSTIVNIDLITSIQPYFESDYIVIMKDGKKFRMSKSRKEKMKQQFSL